MERPSTQRPVEALATCSAACPVQTDTREYVQRISRGDYEGALDILLESNPFPSVCSRICHHPCEAECRRKAIDEAVGLRMLKRFVVENTRDYRIKRRHKVEPVKGKSVAIVGAGPAGLTAARDLALLGYRVTVFEKNPTLGGMLAHAIPRYRLPTDAIQEDIDDVLATGVQVKANCQVGRDVTFQELRKEHDAVLLAVGLAQSHSLPIPGINSGGILLAIPFLWDVANGAAPSLGDRVVVVGGGNVAIDVARTARRLGASQVTMACLESRVEMPAWKWEVEEAEEEGVTIANSWGPKAILEDGGRTTGIVFRRCTRVFDENRRFSPQYDEAETLTLEVDNVIVTIGQKSDLACVENSAVEVTQGRLVCDRSTMGTSEPGVFSCGEVMTGPGSAIQAVASGHDAAKVIDHYLETGEILKLPARLLTTIGELPLETAERAKKFQRMEAGLLDASERVRDFTPIEHGYTEAEALAEARRCLACATGAHLEPGAICAGCLTCVRICPFGVPTVDRTAVFPDQKCQTCGLCAAECPAAGLALSRFATNKMKSTLQTVLGEDGLRGVARPFVVSFCCLNSTTSRTFLREQTREEIASSGVLRVMVPCVGRVSAVDMLSPFELGADRVAVITCAHDGCFYTGAEELLQRRIRYVRDFLNQIKTGEENLLYFQTDGSAEASWPRFWEEARKAELTKTAVG